MGLKCLTMPGAATTVNSRVPEREAGLPCELEERPLHDGNALTEILRRKLRTLEHRTRLEFHTPNG